LELLKIYVIRHAAVIITLILLLIASKVLLLQMSLFVDHIIVQQVFHRPSLYLKLSDHLQVKIIDHSVDVLMKELHLIGHLFVYVVFDHLRVHIFVLKRVFRILYIVNLVLNHISR
jgi:hypothetical protein